MLTRSFITMKQPTVLTITFLSGHSNFLSMCVYTEIHIVDTYRATVCIAAFSEITELSSIFCNAGIFLSLYEFPDSFWILKLELCSPPLTDL